MDTSTADSSADAQLASTLRASSPSPADTAADVNPRKRKKASRACDYCHLNHQPCDNGKPRCSVCEKHNKACNYLRPTKRRGPQKGYRTALNNYKESAAAWGVALGAIPGLDALIEGHLRSDNGKSFLKAIKDPSQQDALIQKWQQSTVFKTFFPNSSSATGNDAEDGDGDEAGNGIDAAAPPVRKSRIIVNSPTHDEQPKFDLDEVEIQADSMPQAVPSLGDLTSLSDIVAMDAARSSSRQLQTLAPLGFAPNETIADFYDIGSNSEHLQQSNFLDFDLGTDAEQQVYYELLMGRSFDNSFQ